MNYLSAKFILAPITVAPTSTVWHSSKCCEISILRAVLWVRGKRLKWNGWRSF